MKQKGFTLVELGITVLVVVILMSISIPIYRANLSNYKKAEGYALLATIRAAQEKYYSEWGTFLASSNSSANASGTVTSSNSNDSFYTCNEIILGINAITNKYYTWFCVSGSVGYDNGENIDALAHRNKAFKFTAVVKSKELGGMYLNYNLTSGVTIY